MDESSGPQIWFLIYTQEEIVHMFKNHVQNGSIFWSESTRSNRKLFTERKIHNKILAYSYTKRILYSSEVE